MESTLSILEEDILSDIDERKELMLSTKTLFLRYNFLEKDENFFLNYSIPIVYSIWEGFVQTSFQTLVREINKLELSKESICRPIFIYSTEQNFRQLKEYPTKFPNKVIFFEKLNHYFKTDKFELNPIVNTENNVGFRVLNRILESFNLCPIPEFTEPKYSIKDELDKFLLKIRNDVSHGNNAVIVDRDGLERAIVLVEKLMDLVFDRIKIGFLVEKSFLVNE